MSLKFRYVPLTFITDEEQIKVQIKNTIILKYFFDKNKTTVKLKKLIAGTQYGYNASALDAGSNKFLRISDISDGKVDWATVPYCDCLDEETYLLEQEDLLIARTGGTTGKSFLITNPPKKSVFAGYLIRIRANKESIPQFLNLFLNSYVYWSQVTSLNKGDFRPSVNANKLKSLLLPRCSRLEQFDAIKLSKGERVNGYEFLQREISKALEDFERCKEISNYLKNQKNIISNLKQSILQEAVQGKLTAEWRKQNPDVEPASELLERIKAKKAKLIKDRKIKKEKILTPIAEEEIPFELPGPWIWCRMQDTGLFERGKSKHRPRNDARLFSNGTIPFVQTGEVARSKDHNYLIDSCSTYYNDYGLAQSRLWPKGTMCITIAANIAQTGFLDIEACFPDSVVGFTALSDKSISKYVRFFIDLTKTEIEKFAPATAQKNINLGIINLLKLPLPPEEEIKAIVEKVETLMQKCNELEREFIQSEEHTNMLIQAVLKEVFEAKPKVLPKLEELESSHFAKRKMLASYIINQSANDIKFGDTKFEKLLYLTDYHILKRNFGQEYKQKAAGPYDNKFTVQFFNQTIKAGWFYKQPLGNMNRILQGKNYNKSQNTYDYFSVDELKKIDGLIETFKNFDYKIPEIISTIYAVWNNRIIKNQKITDELLKQDFLEWDKGKAQYVYPKDRVTPAIKWMKENGFVPDGWGKIIELPKSKKTK